MIEDFLNESHKEELDFYRLRQREAKDYKLNQQYVYL